MRIAVLLLHPVWSFDLNATIQIFDDSSRPQNTIVLDFVSPSTSMALDHGMSIATEPLADYIARCDGVHGDGCAGTHPDLIILPGFADPFAIAADRRTGDDKAALFCRNPHDALMARDWLNAERDRGCEIAAMCTGVFALGWMGLLDGVDCTTHLPFVEDLQAQFPKALVAKDRVLTHDGRRRIWTGAGGSVCLDLCLAILSEHAGEAAAADEATMLALHYPRSVNSRRRTTPAGTMASHRQDEITLLARRVREHLGHEWSLPALAQTAHMSPRTFQRRFAEAMGMPPKRWILEQRLKAAKELLELTDLPMYTIASRVGLHDADSLRKRFTLAFGMTPSEYRSRHRR
ncbi:GlxA family transcriptional regulator [Bifidobacterium saguinibicoloris]|uniref:GlxA family transcriptional regulator n=1 Tax=Bifidobacterium saguinibicoloris TaxID=2834433 RepID=UPI001C5A2734|nr:helix-turn-helix domain-containing protein [Bifidobacterium saguinibicoloris]MBW3081437.1 helix-turn-helix domain-containing protein [Bifidobacterium saguinibicoloris]